MPQSSAPGTRRAISTAVSCEPEQRQQRRPTVQVAQASPACPVRRRPDRPIAGRSSQSSSPMPAAIACLIEAGIAVISRSRKPMPAVRMKISAGDRHAAERDPPRHLHADDDGVGEEEVVAHRRARPRSDSSPAAPSGRSRTPSTGRWPSAPRRNPCRPRSSTAGCTKMM